MGRPSTKAGLMLAATDNYRKLNVLISGMTEKELLTEFDFEGDEKKKEAHWKRDKNLRDVMIHLYEWQPKRRAYAVPSPALQLENLWRYECGILEKTSKHIVGGGEEDG